MDHKEDSNTNNDNTLNKSRDVHVYRQDMRRENENDEIYQLPQIEHPYLDAIESFMKSYFKKKQYRYTTNKEITLSLRDAFIYFMFLLMLTISCFSMHNSHFYYYQNAIVKTFGQRFFVITPTNTISFETVQTKHDFWNFMEVNFLSVMHRLPRRRGANLTVRVRSETCKPSYHPNFTTCYPKYDKDFIDRSPYYKGSKFYEENEARSVDIRGTAENYEASGYIEHLDYEYHKSLETIRRLKNLDWIDRGTRLVMVQFTTVNQNGNFFSLVRIKAEVLPCGFLQPTIHVWNINMLSFFDQPSIVNKIVNVALYICVIYYTVVELYEIRAVTLQLYFFSLRNIIDLSILVICYAILLTNIWHSKVVSFFQKHSIFKPEVQEKYSVEGLLVVHNFYVDMTAIVIVLTYLNLFKFISFHRAMVILVEVFRRSASQLFIFTLVFILIFIMYAFLGVLVFSRTNLEFLYFGKSILTMARIITGDLNLKELINANRFWAPFFLMSYMVVVIFFLLNIFIAIINFNYIEIKSGPLPPESMFFTYINDRIQIVLYYMHLAKKPSLHTHIKKIDIVREEEVVDVKREKFPENYITYVDLPQDVDDEIKTMNASLDEIERTLERFMKNARRIQRRL